MRFGFGLFAFPLIVSLSVANLIAGPLLAQWEAGSPQSFALTDRQKIELAEEIE